MLRTCCSELLSIVLTMPKLIRRRASFYLQCEIVILVIISTDDKSSFSEVCCCRTVSQWTTLQCAHAAPLTVQVREVFIPSVTVEHAITWNISVNSHVMIMSTMWLSQTSGRVTLKCKDILSTQLLGVLFRVYICWHLRVWDTASLSTWNTEYFLDVSHA